MQGSFCKRDEMSCFNPTIPLYDIVQESMKTTAVLFDGIRNFSNAMLPTEALWSIDDPPSQKEAAFLLPSTVLHNPDLYQQPTAPHPR